MAGNFNYVEGYADRISIQRGEGQIGLADVEASEIRRVLLDPIPLVELEQGAHTRRGHDSVSKLDRIYSNHHVVEQLLCDVFLLSSESLGRLVGPLSGYRGSTDTHGLSHFDSYSLLGVPRPALPGLCA